MQLVLPWKNSKSEPVETSDEKKTIFHRLHRKPKKKTLILIAVLAVLLTAGSVGLYFLFFAEEEAVALTDVTTAGSLSTSIEGTGTTLPADSVTYTVASEADILEVCVSAGDTVKEGDLLYVQDDSEIDDALADYREEIASLSNKLDEYNDTLEELQQSIASLTVTAPFSGRLLEVSAEEGNEAKAGSQLALLVDDSTMKITQYFSYAYEDEIYKGMTGSISIASQMLALKATVTDVDKVERITAEGTKCFAVTMEVDNPGSLTEGMTGAGYLLSNLGDKIYPAVEGTLEYINSEVITAEASGEFTYVNAADYQKVTKGQTLFVIDGDAYENQLSSVSRNISSTENSIAAYEERIAEAEESRADYTVRSEISGKVIMVNVRVGQTPRAGITSVMVYNLDTMTVTANIDELDIDNITNGMPVRIVQSGAENDTEYKGKITEISYEATNTDGVAYFPVTVEIESGGAISAGINVSYYITVGDEEEGVLAPISALKSTTEGTCLFVQADSRPDNAVDLGDDVDMPEGFYAVPVTTGVSNNQYVRILSGVESGTTVFLRYQQAAPSDGDTTSESQDEVTTSESSRDNFSGMPPGGMNGGNMSNIGGPVG